VHKNPPRILSLLGLLLLFGTVANAQQPPQQLVAQLKKAVVVVTTQDAQGRALLQGSGFFIAPDRIVTNLHVVRAAHDIRVQTFNGETIVVDSIVATDPNGDLALLRINRPASGTTTLQVEELGALEGDDVLVISNPRGSHWKVTAGQVGTSWNFEHLGTRMQITASLEPGSSGGPVVNLRGHVVGVAVMHIEGADNIELAVPAERLTALRPRN
jgi:serine protease Do